tara:strand:- start:443 stop:679 length:237 start_codon:yes stop_codon:yes gene_type:complete
MSLSKLKKQYEKLGEEIQEIENSQPEKWYKVFAPMWSENDGTIIRFSISYINETALKKVDGYKILEEYSDKGTMLNAL